MPLQEARLRVRGQNTLFLAWGGFLQFSIQRNSLLHDHPRLRPSQSIILIDRVDPPFATQFYAIPSGLQNTEYRVGMTE